VQEEVGSASLNRCLIGVDLADKGRAGRRRGEALAVSALVQVCIVTLLVIAPLFATSTRFVTSRVDVIPPYGGIAQSDHPSTPPQPRQGKHHGDLLLSRIQISAPTKIPPRVMEIDGEKLAAEAFSPANSSGASDFSLGTGIGLIPIPGGRGGPIPPQPVAPPASIPRTPVSISQGVQLALLTHRVEPIYPLIARQARVEGTVQLRAIIARDGSVEHLEVLSGHPLLVHAASEAVRQWRFRPTVLNGEAVEVDTYITVVFHLSQ
jgi:protein TonB